MNQNKYLLIIGHPDKKSFCYNGIFKTILREMKRHTQQYEIIDLYEDKLHRDKDELIQSYKDLVKYSLMRYLHQALLISLYLYSVSMHTQNPFLVIKKLEHILHMEHQCYLLLLCILTL